MKRTIVSGKEQSLIQESAMQRMLNVLFWFPDIEFSLSELAREATISKSTASKLLPVLVHANMVTVQDKGIIHRIAAKTESFEFKKRKIAFNLAVIYHSNIVEFLNEKFEHPRAIILMGSYRLGEDISSSDIDIAIEVNNVEEMKSFRLEELTALEKELQRHIQIHTFNRKRIDHNVLNNIINGIVLYGYLELNHG